MYVYDEDVDVSGRVYMSPTHREGEGNGTVRCYGGFCRGQSVGGIRAAGQGGDKGPA